MALTNSYLQGVYETVQKRNPNEPEFQQAVYEVLESLQPVVEARPELEKNGIMERIVEPERMFMFRVPWVDDQGKVQVNRLQCFRRQRDRRDRGDHLPQVYLQILRSVRRIPYVLYQCF